ncbi:MAG: HNH endonuclease [Prosthecobacter sp.]|uniref:HNH endonuclease n=1 Tax=Prosthecobacter sp. TaxID=1965333 RepID=UPI0038FF0587
MPARPRVSEKLRRVVFARAGFRCEYCQSSEALSASPFVAEHIVPLACGGRTSAENLACACHGCNLLKADHQTGWDVVTHQEVSLFDPRADRWPEHFHWSSNGQEIIPFTSKGRATVHRLSLNRPGLRNLRRLMCLADKAFPFSGAE